MHLSSYNAMRDFFDKYLSMDSRIEILDVGSLAVKETSMTYRKLVSENWKYEGLDMVGGKNVDIVVGDTYSWNMGEGVYDVVISGQMLEHSKYPWLVMAEIARVVKTGGLICVIAPSSGYEHRFPIDCYRFYPDGMRALAELAGIEVLECYCNDVSPWRDTVLIGRKA